MKKTFIIDYSGYILLRFIGPIIRCLPKRFAFFLGKLLGRLLYIFDFRHRPIVYTNLKTAFGGKLSPAKLLDVTREFYQCFGQNLIEVFFIPLIDKSYISKYITIEGLNYIIEAFKKKRGVILLGVHAGSWELSNVICANLGFPFVLLVRDQRYPNLDRLLYSYRFQKGCRVIQRKNGLRDMLSALKENQAVGMTQDQGGKTGLQVKFFGKDASLPSGAVRLALKYDLVLLPAFYTRLNGPKIKVMIEPPFSLKKTQDREKEVYENVQQLVHIFEKYILSYPQEYMWTYKIWKYSKEQRILILDDGRTGHLRQAEALAKIVSDYLKDKGVVADVDRIAVKFKNKLTRFALALNISGCLLARLNCQGCLKCLRKFLEENTYKSLVSEKPDTVISCGSQAALVNFVLSRENLAKSLVIMRPSILSTRRFNLAIIPRHDNFKKGKNVVITKGALNLCDEEYLREQVQRLRQSQIVSSGLSNFCIGLLIGGDTKDFSLRDDTVLEVIKEIKSLDTRYHADILVTTSRRTSRDLENLAKIEFKDYPACKLLVIANEKNLPFVLPGILGISQMVICSPESISMISEAVNSKRYVLVFQCQGLRKRHQRFLESFAQNKYIYLVKPQDLSKAIEELWLKRPPIHTLSDNHLVRQAIKSIL